MISKNGAQICGFNLIGSIFPADYLKENCKNAGCMISDVYDGKYEYFLGFESDTKSHIWTVYASVSINADNGNAIFLDYRLPSGLRMKNPVKRVRLS